MHLMYTVDDQGNRIYTLKVSVILTQRVENSSLIALETHRCGKNYKVGSSRCVKAA